MGKPYLSELNSLPMTYEWAQSQPIKSLVAAIESCFPYPLIVTGSGGSLTAANFVSNLHQRQTGNLSKSVTPLEIVFSMQNPSESAVMILSAGGRNPDVLAALKKVIALEARQIVVMCSRTSSPLARLASRYSHIRRYEFDLPTGSDGFLATNSLLAFLILLTRAYSTVLRSTDPLPESFQALVYPEESKEQFQKKLIAVCEPLWEREHLIVLHGDSTRPGAVDIESKFTEAALGAVLPSDYRNFAHGRHHWLAKRGPTTGVVALMSLEDEFLARKTIELLPKSIPIVAFNFKQNHTAAGIASVVAALQITGLAGIARKLDPGRPGVPTFGRRIYNLRGFANLPDGRRNREGLAIWRKTGNEPSFHSQAELEFWKKAYREFLDRLTKQYRYGAIALDYDETLCDSRDRLCGISDDTVSAFTKILKQGMVVGVATGRGKSVRADLCAKISKRFWPQIMVGYYNGAEIGLLDDGAVPKAQNDSGAELQQVATRLQSNRILSQLATLECRDSQLTIQPRSGSKFHILWEVAQQILSENQANKLNLVRSGHSIDILKQGVSKKNLVDALRNQNKSTDLKILCIGDKGRWPGNDFALLSEPASLSVDECSFDPATCWNLAPSGFRGAKATIFYLNCLRPASSGARFVISPI
jgi:hydroxymethylpyrimidine pyrophosphatase-like HAD family hydrolase/fructoselysine-6-P-deglycase FrlB-like protein